MKEVMRGHLALQQGTSSPAPLKYAPMETMRFLCSQTVDELRLVSFKISTFFHYLTCLPES